MAYKVKIDNVEYDLKDNFTIKEELNETLDSATVQFATYGGEANFESFDVMQIYDTENKISKKYFLVDSFDDEIYSFGENFDADDHSYTVSAFSETKALERITLPNCSVTQPTNEFATKKSVYDEILRFYILYCPTIKVFDINATYKYSYKRKYTIDSAIQTRFSRIECPEFQWNEPTLREVLNDLVSTDDCIIVVKQGVISFYDLKAKGNPIDTSMLSSSKRTMSSQDYAGELTINMQNAIGKESTLVCENITLRAPEGEGSLTTSNGVIKTQHPIYGIKRLRVKVPIRYRPNGADTPDSDSYYYAWIDITDRVVEEEEFNLLSNVKVSTAGLYQQLSSFTDQNGVTEKKHKVNFLYYKRGSNDIFNFATPYSCTNDITAPSQSNIDFGLYALGKAVEQIYDISGYVNQIIRIGEANDPRNMIFYLEYETLAEHAIRVGKYLPCKHPDNRIFDNQSNSYVDQEHLSIFEYAKINRLGHKLRTITGFYTSESQIPQLGDYIGDEILFSREVTYQDSGFQFVGYMTPHYVLKDFFTGVRAKKRSWEIAKNEEALTRHDVYKLYIEASFQQKYDKFDFSNGDGITYLNNEIVPALIPFGKTIASPYKTLACAVQTRVLNNLSFENDDIIYPSNDNYIFMDSEAVVLGMSFCVTFGFNDNYKSADYIILDGESLETAEHIQQFYSYTNEKGEYDESRILLFTQNLKTNTDSQITDSSLSALRYAVERGYSLPKISSGSIPSFSDVYEIRTNVQKDNREIIKHTIQYEFCSDTKDIIITNQFLKRIQFVSREAHNAYEYQVHMSNQRYDKDATQPLGEVFTDARIYLFHSGESYQQDARVMIRNQYGNNYPIPDWAKSWGISDKNGKLLLGVNIPQSTSSMQCWFNLLKNRDYKVYSDTYNGVRVGDITSQGLTELLAYAYFGETASETVQVQRRTVVRSETISNGDENE